MAPSADTSIASHVANQFTPIEKDRWMESRQAIHTTSGAATTTEDFHLIGHISHLDHERQPDIMMHVKGSGAQEFFENTAR
ncbi:hypothetical protein F5X97DRAFT_314182 [Nemania serpens]|nr:hypothetical protein F5X97DRAFT_314182 [Nemania serpens]